MNYKHFSMDRNGGMFVSTAGGGRSRPEISAPFDSLATSLCGPLEFLVYLLPFKSYFMFFIWLFGRSQVRNTIRDLVVIPSRKGTSLHQTASFEPLGQNRLISAVGL